MSNTSSSSTEDTSPDSTMYLASQSINSPESSMNISSKSQSLTYPISFSQIHPIINHFQTLLPSLSSSTPQSWLTLHFISGLIRLTSFTSDSLKAHTPFDSIITSVRKQIDHLILTPSSSPNSDIRYVTGLVSLYVELILKPGFRCNTDRGRFELTRAFRVFLKVREMENVLRGASKTEDKIGLDTSAYTLLVNRALSSSPDTVKSWVVTSCLDVTFLGSLGWWYVDLVLILMSGSRGLDVSPVIHGLSSTLASLSSAISSPVKWTVAGVVIASLATLGRRTKELLGWYANGVLGDAAYDGNGGIDGGRVEEFCRCFKVCAARGEAGGETVKLLGERMREIGRGGLRVGRGGRGGLLKVMGECMAMGVAEGFKEEGYRAVEGWGVREEGGGKAGWEIKAALAKEYGGSMKAMEGGRRDMMDFEKAVYNYNIIKGARRGVRSNVKVTVERRGEWTERQEKRGREEEKEWERKRTRIMERRGRELENGPVEDAVGGAVDSANDGGDAIKKFSNDAAIDTTTTDANLISSSETTTTVAPSIATANLPNPPPPNCDPPYATIDIAPEPTQPPPSAMHDKHPAEEDDGDEEIPDIEEDDDEIPDIFGGEADEDDL
ncbi:hypothetical protein TrCOL_g13858 [Triparma columacea]|uniref:Uncharacterized protein n=1 Tax=Triparma columacea TaxID=722753 RepID=A0A9W7L6Z1_9STRA|nr:hypothetical protein TrCOL_g13858 [Triparma columacea]